MTPTNKTKLKDDSEVRSMEVLCLRALEAEAEAEDKEDEEEEKFIVEGYAARYEPYVLYKDEDGDIYEQFTKENFEGADRSDIIFQYDHAGKVYARTSNGSLTVEPDDEGLHIVADLGRTESARQMYEEIKAGMVTKMSWRFAVPADAYQYDKKKRLLTYSGISKIYDVSAVSIPANDSTSISARNFVNGEIEKENARIEAARKLEETKAEILKILEANTNDA